MQNFYQISGKRHETTSEERFLLRVSQLNYPANCVNDIEKRELVRCLINENNDGQLQKLWNRATLEASADNKFQIHLETLIM